LKKKYELNVTCTNGPTAASAPTVTQRKGAKAARGPVKAKAGQNTLTATKAGTDKPKKKSAASRRKRTTKEMDDAIADILEESAPQKDAADDLDQAEEADEEVTNGTCLELVYLQETE
jgi:BRCT domain type II-containing protein